MGLFSNLFGKAKKMVQDIFTNNNTQYIEESREEYYEEPVDEYVEDIEDEETTFEDESWWEDYQAEELHSENKPSQSLWEEEYYDERKRIQNIIDEYLEDDYVLDVHYDLPPIPEFIEYEDVVELQDITESDILLTVEWYDPNDYGIESFEEADEIIGNYLANMSTYNKHFYNFMKKFVRELENNPDVGKKRLARALQDNMDAGNLPTTQQRYNLDDILTFLSETLDAMPDISSTEKAHIMDDFEVNEVWNEDLKYG